MKHYWIIPALAAAAVAPALAQKAQNPFAGRWDITATTPDQKYPGWMEVVEKNGDLQVRVQPRTGNVRPAAAAWMDESELMVTVIAESEGHRELTWELSETGGKLSGVQKLGGRIEARLTGVRAPELKRAAPKAWTDPQPLFNGKDLAGWEPLNNTPGLMGIPPGASHWAAMDGDLVNLAKGSNLRTTRKFDDFKLHIEFNCPADENSGVYLRGRYEVQVEPGTASAHGGAGGAPHYPGSLGSIYGFLEFPLTNPKPAGEWQTYDITLVGRTVTVVLNGVTGIDHQEIPGVTGGALDSNEADPGPILLQGDHHGGIRYRNITISVPKS